MRLGSGAIWAVMLLGLAGGLTAQENQQTTAATKATEQQTGSMPGDSHVRIVRLSQAQGTLAMDRGTGKGFEQVMQNMPVVEGSKLQTDNGYAEVEFEDGSTMRLAPDTRVEFPQLVLRGSGVKVTTVNLVRGTVYVSLENSKDNDLTLKAGQAAMTVAPATHMRVETAWPKVVVAVFGGDVSVQSGGTTTMVGKKESATLDATEASKVVVDKKIAADTYDGWDKQEVDYQKRYSKGNAYAGGGYSYGLSDLNYYGGFVNGACGSMWQPYFVSAAWDPYGNGAWAWYPGAGYSWVSPYPWGWLPYHTGAWAFCPGMGWGWQPGGAWRGLVNVVPGQPLVGNTGTSAGGVRPVGPPKPPVAMASTLVVANRQPLVVSKQSSPGNFVFERDSAGLGVPRGSLGELKGISNGVEHHGFVNMPVYEERARGDSAHPMNAGPTALRQGSPIVVSGAVRPGGASEGESHGGPAMEASHASPAGAPNNGSSNSSTGGKSPK